MKELEEKPTDLVELRERVWSFPLGTKSFRLCIWGNFFNLQIMPKLERDFGILRDEFNILLCLVNNGRLSGADICRIVGRPRNSISRCAERLIARKLISSHATPTDKRQTIFAVLPEGRDLYEKMLPHLVALEEEVMAELSPEEFEALDRIMAKLVSIRAQSKWTL